MSQPKAPLDHLREDPIQKTKIISMCTTLTPSQIITTPTAFNYIAKIKRKEKPFGDK